MPLQNICCTWRSTSHLPLLALKKKAKNFKSDLIFSRYVYSRFTIKDCSSSRFRESTSITSITIHNGFSAHHDSWITKMFHHGVTKTNISSPTPCSNAAYGQTYFKTFFLYLYVRVSATQVCTRAVVRKIHKDKHQVGALIGVPQLWPLLQPN